MCLALKNSLLMSQPLPNKVSCFSPHFTPLYHTNEDACTELQLRLEEQAKNGKLLSDNLELVTTQKISYPESYNNIRQVSKNFHSLVQELAGETSIMLLELQNVKEHVVRFK